MDPATRRRAAVMDTEAFLLRRLRDGDERAYATLVRTHGARMLAVARRMLRHEEDAHDVVQEAWMQAFRALPRFEGQSRLSTWLHRITVNAALMKIRAQRRRPLDPVAALRDGDDGDLFDAIASSDASADAALAGRERRALVRQALAQLPEAHRAVLTLRDFEDLDTDESARRLGTTTGAAKTRLHRARQALREAIEREYAACVDRFAVSLAEVAI